MKVVRYIIIFFLWAQTLFVCAQNQTYLDSLSLASDLFEQQKYNDVEKILLSIDNNCNTSTPEVQIYYNYIKGCTSYFLEKPNEAIPSFDRAIKLMEEHCDTLGQDYYECMHGIGSSYLTLNDTVTAEKHWRHAFIRSLTAPAEVIKTCGVMGDIITSLGDLYNAKGDTLLARDIYYYATQVSLMMIGDTGLENLPPEVLNKYVEQQNAEGLEFMRAGHYTDATNRFTELIKLCEDNKNDYWPGILFHNLGRTWMLQEEYDKALQCLEKAKQIQISASGSPMERTITYIKECKTRQ